MKKSFCDRCGREISNDELSMVVPAYISTITTYLRIDKDICAKCMTEFITKFWEESSN